MKCVMHMRLFGYINVCVPQKGTVQRYHPSLWTSLVKYWESVLVGSEIGGKQLEINSTLCLPGICVYGHMV
eukprot:m.226020 g.226020  ORF g.226020 m.226020 type:complete len:71 (+) comp13863_c3_seq1:203-415(+)